MISIRKTVIAAAAFAVCVSALPAQEAIGSIEEQYYGFLELIGAAERPLLNYRTLSDNEWTASDALGPWKADSLPRRRSAGTLQFRLYGPEVFASYNTAYPHGANDGALWQGVGLNATVTAGINAKAYGFEATFKPTLLWEENRSFDILPGVYGSEYSYFWNAGIDLPQRLGDSSRLYFDWGDSEIRYSWKTLTIGFGTQSAWIGPGNQNAIILSNNAPSFPKLDIGLRKTATPIGDIEGRVISGILTESDHFDDDETNNSTILGGLSLSWQPIFFKELTLGFHRTMMSKPDASGLKAFRYLFWSMEASAGNDEQDQRASLTAQMDFPDVGFSCWVEWARNDFSPNLDFILRYPFHSQGYTIGLRKAFRVAAFGGTYLELLAEATNLESSRDYEFLWRYYFYGHHIVRQGYTNQGQIIGAGIQGGGNSQYLSMSLYHPVGLARFYVQRRNRDNDYVYFLNMGGTIDEKRQDEYKISTELTVGVDTHWRVHPSWRYGAGAAYCLNLNPLYNPNGYSSTVLNNFYVTASITYQLN